MTTNYNAPNSQYNKTEFVKLGVMEAKEIAFSEAIYGGNDEKLVVMAWVEKIPDIKNFDDKNFVFTPSICIFEILLKPYTYKEKTVEPTPGMLLAAHALKAVEPGMPFSGHFDFAASIFDYECIVLGAASGAEIPQQMRDMMAGNSCPIVPLAGLDKLAGKSLPEIRKGGQSSYSKGETTQERISAKLNFLKKVGAGDADVLELCAIAGMDITKFMEIGLGKILD